MNESESAVLTTAPTTVPFWIAGAKSDAHSTRLGEITNPSTGSVIRTVPYADATDVDRAAARAAFPAWRATPAVRRARILARFRELLERHQRKLATLVSEEHGKVLLDAMGSVQRGIESRRVRLRRAAPPERRAGRVGRARR